MIKTEIKALAEPGPRCAHCGAFAVEVRVTKTVEIHNDKTNYHRSYVSESSETACGICELLQADCTCLPV
jgi:hypothetical protein